MAKFERFEDIEAWKLGREVTNDIYVLSSTGLFARDFALRDQMRRAAISITSNIAEGFERGGDNEFVQFLSHAKGSSGELRSQLYVALDQKYIKPEAFEQAREKLTRISRMTCGLMDYLRDSDFRGKKYRR